jgi:hypothetical protein
MCMLPLDYYAVQPYCDPFKETPGGPQMASWQAPAWWPAPYELGPKVYAFDLPISANPITPLRRFHGGFTPVI